MKDYKKQFEIQQAKIIKKFHKKLNIKPSATQTEINERYLEYANSGGDISPIHISERGQKNNAAFMLALYKATKGKLLYFEPSKALQKDFDFMIEYIKLCHERFSNDFSQTPDIISIVRNYKELVKSPMFLTKLNHAFPECNLLKLIEASADMYDTTFTNNTTKSTIEKLPTEILLDQAKRLGGEVVLRLGKWHPEHVNVVAAGIERDGFRSLVYLDKSEILKNKNLIIKAFQKDGSEELQNYFIHELSPRRNIYYMAHGEPHYDSFFDRYYVEILNNLINDSEFIASINIDETTKNDLIQTIQFEVKRFTTKEETQYQSQTNSLER